MPKTKGQGLVFGILMSVTMAYGMEVCNVALKSGVLQHVGGFSDMRNTVFLGALKEAAYMWVIVLVISTLWGNRQGAKLCSRRGGIGGWQVAAALRSYRPMKVYTDQGKQQKTGRDLMVSAGL